MRAYIAALTVALTTATGAFAASAEGITLRQDEPRITRAQGTNGLGAASTGAPEEIVREWFGHGLSGSAVGRVSSPSLVLERQNHVARTGTTHVTMEQQYQGLRVYGSYVKASVRDGELVSVIDATLPVNGQIAPATITPERALRVAIRHHWPNEFSAPLALHQVDSNRESVSFGRGGFFHAEPVVERVIVPLSDGTFQEGFLVETWSDEDNQLWHTLVGATGTIVYTELRTANEGYLIFPEHPGISSQTLVQGAGSGNAYSPIGWVSNNTTIGNNVDAYLDRDNNNAADSGGRPVMDSNGNFNFVVNLSLAPTESTNQKAAVTNLFYLNNVIHDKLYRHGFTEAAGNFQTNNFGLGGSGNDPVNAEAQDGGGTDNANFSTPADGSRPRMQMYLWTYSTPNRDGDLDSDIVWHEYGHGLTWRMIGSMSGGLAGAIGEGMSDVLSIYTNRNDVVGEYSYNNSKGIRRYPYTNYPLTYGDTTGSSVHSDGEIYAAAMWKLLSLWEGAGHTQDELFDVVIDGMNYTPSNPEYEEMRDGILAAIPERAKQCIVWNAFAQFGIGVNASGSDSCNFFGCSVSVSEDFTVPSDCADGGGEPTNAPPSASFTFTTSSLTANFTSTSSDPDADISSYSWTFGDGATAAVANPSHTYSAGGTYSVTLTVTDSAGQSDSATQSVTVSGGSTGGGITLTASGYKVKGVKTVDLTWSGATTAVDVYRDGSVIASATANDGAYTDNTGSKGGGSYTYKVCETGTSVCSANVSVAF